MPNNPYDEILRSIARILEDVLGEDGEPPRIIGCAIFACGESPDKGPCQDDRGRGGFAYEVTDSEQCLYISAGVPPKCEGQVSVAFEPRAVTLRIGERVETIDLDDDIDPGNSSFSVHHGVLDVVCVKARGDESSL